ncbi:AAA family ATPase [Saccharicrinis fermentans]|uniref:AAA domain-containing protein n=1 Tax=Saccharicrinis fermentans DSM 9555 = JCM 21142 TaxID=869213 RepID=W7YQF9_9BACT|nr:AAA family ATPase [Saccharicrinis fermentans]GAF04639.1 hypothetical protein JCM21142_93351 [Saccharicrinis fermentans DSM 9555 = JCM 21142]
MINKIGIQNFRVFKDLHEFELKPYTLLTGTNNSGKSALQKILFLLKKSVVKNYDITSFDQLKFDSEVMGTIEDYFKNLNYQNTNNQLVLTFSVSDEKGESIDYKLVYEPSIENNIHLKEAEIYKDNEKVMWFDKIPFEQYIEENKWLNSEVKSDAFKNKYVWRINPDTDPEKLPLYIYNTLLQQKKEEIRQYYIARIDQMSDIGEYSEKQEMWKDKLEKEGFSFSDERAHELVKPILDKNRDLAPTDFRYVWDNKLNAPWQFDRQLKQACNAFYDLNDEILIPSKLSQVVLKTENFFEASFTDTKLKKLRETLIKNEIFTREAFLNSYKDFELALIYLVAYQQKSITQRLIYGSNKEDYLLIQKELEFVEFFKYHATRNNVNELLNRALITKNAIVNILLSEDYRLLFKNDSKTNRKSFLRVYNEHSPIKNTNSPTNQKEEIKNLGDICDRIQEAVLEPIALLGKSLKNDITTIRFGMHETALKRLFFYADRNSHNSIYYDFAKTILGDNKSEHSNLKFVNQWLAHFEIGEALVIKPIVIENSEVGISYNILNDNKEYSVGDYGLGVNMLLLLLIRIVEAKENAILMLEEPESNLHPAFQSKLAELLADAHEHYHIRFVVETHSEYLIRKFQYLVASPKYSVKADDVSISYLYHPDKIPQGKKQVEKLEIRPDGILKQDFGEGFFDENARLTMDLLKLQNQN